MYDICKQGVPARCDEDVMLAHYALCETRGTHDLKQLSADLLGATDYDTAVHDWLKTEKKRRRKAVYDAKSFKKRQVTAAKNMVKKAWATAASEKAKAEKRLASTVKYMYERRVLPRAGFEGPFIEESQSVGPIEDFLVYDLSCLSDDEVEIPVFEPLEGYAQVPPEIILPYLAMDCDYTWQLFEKLRPEVEAEPGLNQLYTETLMQASQFLQRIEDRGIFVDFQHLQKLKVELGGRKEAAESAVAHAVVPLWDPATYRKQTGAKTAPATFNVASTPQLRWLIFDQIGIRLPPGVKKTTNRAVLDIIKDRSPIFPLLLEYRRVSKMLSTYVIAVENRLDANGRVHSTFKIIGTECVTGDTLIWTAAGLLRADELCQDVDGFTESTFGLLTHCGPSTTSHTYVSRQRQTKHVRMGCGLDVTCTPEHPLLTERGWVSAMELQVGDYVQTSFGARYFPSSLNDDDRSVALAELVGMFLADGWVRWNEQTGHYSVNFCNYDAAVRVRIKELAESVYGPDCTRWDETTGTTRIKGRSTAAIWKEWFPVNGVTRKAVPSFIRRGSERVLKAFVRGCSLDSSWCFTSNGKNKGVTYSIIFRSVNKERLAIVQQILWNLGVRSSLVKEKVYESRGRRTGVGTWDCYKLKLSSNMTYLYIDEIGPLSTKQQQFAVELASKPLPRSWTQNNFRTVGGVLYVKVLEVQDGPIADVYDLTVPTYNSFIANGVVSHNTGRLSSADPNMQNIPTDTSIKNLFAAPPGYIFVEVDQSQAELRVAAALSGDKALAEIYQKGLDLHTEVTIAIYGDAFLNCTNKEMRTRMRRDAKTVNFGILFGMTAKLLSSRLGITYDEAQRMIDIWFDRFPDVKRFLSHCRSMPAKRRHLQTVFGRRRRFPLITVENLHKLQNEAGNFPIQSVASDLTLMAGMSIDQELEAMGALIVNIVHDSLLIQVPDNAMTIYNVVNIARNAMIQTAVDYLGDTVPFDADAKVGINWGDCHDYKLEMPEGLRKVS